MNTLKTLLLASTLAGLFACTPTQQPQKPTSQSGYLKADISQAALANPADYKRYYYRCQNAETGGESSLVSYFPLSRESRLKENFGFYFQLDGNKVEPFDHISNTELNARGTRFEVLYRSYFAIQGASVELVAREQASTYYKIINGQRQAWLRCREG